jgi:pimeloyl-ACP methyl ester carboxylesterase
VTAVIGSPGYERDEEAIRDRAGRAWDRNHDAIGVARQLLAILASPDRTKDLAAVKVPTLVVHGADDPLVMPSGGEATAAAIPGAQLLMIPGMGHEMSRGVWPQVIDAIVANAAPAQAPAPSGSER